MAQETQLKDIPPDPNSETAQNTPQAAVERLLISFGEQKFRELARYRFAEEREWYESALFYQRRQWLKWNDSARKWALIKQNPNKPKPMPVSNYFAKAVNSNANQLQLPRVIAVPSDDSARNRSAADYAERAIPAIDKESGMDVLYPLLAKHVALWGIGCSKDIFDTSASAGKITVPTPMLKAKMMLSCLDCGQTSELSDAQAAGNGSQATGTANMQPQDDDQPPPPTGNDDHQDGDDRGPQKCPNCGSTNTRTYPSLQLIPAGAKTFTKGRIYTEIPPIFEVFLPRDCRNPNLAPVVLHRYRKPLGVLRRTYGDKAANVKGGAAVDMHDIYLEALRALVNYNYLSEQVSDCATVTELWVKWDELPRRLQNKLEQFWAGDMETLDAAQNDGIYFIYAGGTMLSWGPNFMEGENPFTFYLWELDPANVYPKGVAIDLTPLQKRLNRLDSLIELAFMCNAAGKWLWPATQNYKPPTGSPNEVVPYDVIGDGKVAPTFVQPSPVHGSVWQLRQTIVGDFQQLGNILGVAQGAVQAGMPKSFRGAAYLGAKQDEETNTQRALWERGHEIRYNKVIKMAAKWWDGERKSRIAGFNGKFGMMSLKGDDLKGEFEISVSADSSRPRTISEKQEAFGALASAGLVDLTDGQTRDYVTDLLGMSDVNMTDHLQYLKAERDLETLKQGQMPQPSPFQNPQISFKILSNFTLTEEFEALPPMIQQGIVMAAQLVQNMMQQAAMQAQQAALQSAEEAAGVATTGQPHYINPAAAGPSGPALGNALQKKRSPLSGVPGRSAGTGNVQHAAHQQAGEVAQAAH